MRLLRVGPLPDAPLAAAGLFYAECLPRIAAHMAQGPSDVVLVFGEADYRHRGWRTEAVAALAREYAPARVNGVAGADAAAIGAAFAYLEQGLGVTGQLLRLDSQGAGEVIG